jgi:ABC-type sugar transport system substrate-binding protein
MARSLSLAVGGLAVGGALAAAAAAAAGPLAHPNPTNWWQAAHAGSLAESHGRHLQTTCTPSTTGGDWNGQPPNLNAQSFCGCVAGIAAGLRVARCGRRGL